VKSRQKKVSSDRHDISRITEDILGCKWTVLVLDKLSQGITRPGALTKDTPGLTAKVLNERLRKLVRFGIIERHSFDEIPPRVEYALTPLGHRIAIVLDQLHQIESELIDGDIG